MTNTTDSSRLKEILWVAFDAVGTLVYPAPSVAEVYHRTAMQFGSALSLEEIAGRFRTAFAQSEQEATDHSASTPQPVSLQTSEERERRRWREIVAAVIDDVDDADACFESLYEHFAQPGSWRCFADTAVTLQSLRSAGYRLAIASNFDQRLHALCDGLAELEPIELRVISSIVGHRKPSQRFFESLISATGAAAEEILMVGDDPVNDVEGAIAAGLPVVEINRKGVGGINQIASLSELVELLCP